MNTLIAVDNSGSYRVTLTVTTSLCEEAMQIHGCTTTAAAALGRTLTCAGMMGIGLKSMSDRLTVQIKGSGPAKQVLACADGLGRVKGYIANPAAELPPRADGHLNVGGIVGEGSLTVIKDLGLREPYVGTIPLVNGEIARDFTQYFAVSEQQPGSVALGVRFTKDRAHVAWAGGFIVQVLPDAKDEALDALEETITLMDDITLLIQDAEGDLYKLMDLIFGKLPEEFRPRVLEERTISWMCDCSRERMEKALVSIGKKDLAEIIEEDHGAELTCQFCLKKYRFNEQELRTLLEEASHGQN
ncbi:MAG: Hsp33 family molecular chaperone HslO [Firmicutes bacterium]|nr:Hsp33 family molecular chaperone HslO [Bacillota bacterium]